MSECRTRAFPLSMLCGAVIVKIRMLWWISLTFAGTEQLLCEPYSLLFGTAIRPTHRMVIAGELWNWCPTGIAANGPACSLVGTTNRVVDGPCKEIPPKREQERKGQILSSKLLLFDGSEWLQISESFETARRCSPNRHQDPITQDRFHEVNHSAVSTDHRR